LGLEDTLAHTLPAQIPTRRTQTQRRQDSTQRMLDAALELLGERRSLGFSLADVADRAGYSRGQPSHIFGSRDEMIRQLVPHLQVRNQELFGTPNERSAGLAMLMRTTALLVDPSTAQARITIAVHLLLAEAAGADSPFKAEVAKLNRTAVSYMAANLEAARAAGEIAFAGDDRAKAMLIMAMVRGALLQWLVAPDAVDIAVLRHELVESLRRDLIAKA